MNLRESTESYIAALRKLAGMYYADARQPRYADRSSYLMGKAKAYEDVANDLERMMDETVDSI